ncbi:Trp biosynthesis-associated membrane protein, partial [Saccharomonospora iraqiensis]|uniref:Trp biosynthesis-associated membrane protein n=1 Tax=Saccharomonospora iraqiensis TaxID=52698 RepID=UPI00022DF4CD
MTDGDDPATRAGAARRPLWTALLSLVLAAGALWAASSLIWVEVPRGLTVDGRMADDLSGADLVSWPLPLALLALAAVPALPALPGAGRR